MTVAVTTYLLFRGTCASETALLGHKAKAQWGYTTVGAAKGEAVRRLAVAMDGRCPLFADVPTFRELAMTRWIAPIAALLCQTQPALRRPRCGPA